MAKLFIQLLFCLGLLCCSSHALAIDTFRYAPCWVTKIDCVKSAYAAIGLSKIQYLKNPQLATAQAQTNAITNLALTVKVEVESARFERHLSRNTDEAKRWQSASQETATLRSSIQFEKVKFVDKWLDSNGTLYILVVVEQLSDINNVELPSTKLGNKVYDVTNHHSQVIRSNMEYAQKLTQNIRSEVKAFSY